MKRILKWIVRIVFVLLIVAFLFVFVAYWRSTNDCERLTAAPANPMKAIVYCDYGVKNLKLADIEKPVPNDDQILVRFAQIRSIHTTGTSSKARPSSYGNDRRIAQTKRHTLGR